MPPSTPSEPAIPPRAPSLRPASLLAIALWIATVLLFWQVGHHDFISFDDPDLRLGQSAPWMPASASKGVRLGLQHPAPRLLSPLDLAVPSARCTTVRSPAPRVHSTSSASCCTGLNAALLLLVLTHMTGFLLPRSALVAALFAWHPLHVESVVVDCGAQGRPVRAVLDTGAGGLLRLLR